MFPLLQITWVCWRLSIGLEKKPGFLGWRLGNGFGAWTKGAIVGRASIPGRSADPIDLL
jgi:hypothetical protein